MKKLIASVLLGCLLLGCSGCKNLKPIIEILKDVIKLATKTPPKVVTKVAVKDAAAVAALGRLKGTAVGAERGFVKGIVEGVEAGGTKGATHVPPNRLRLSGDDVDEFDELIQRGRVVGKLLEKKRREQEQREEFQKSLGVPNSLPPKLPSELILRRFTEGPMNDRAPSGVRALMQPPAQSQTSPFDSCLPSQSPLSQPLNRLSGTAKNYPILPPSQFQMPHKPTEPKVDSSQETK